MKSIDLIVCTRNRVNILAETLDSILVHLKVNPEGIRLIVVDNGSSDETSSIIHDRVKLYPRLLLYGFEVDMGLSHARNFGAQMSGADWIGYLDDDLFIDETFFPELKKMINENSYDVFGGKCVPWFKYGRPSWFPREFENNAAALTIGDLGDSEIWGGCMFFKRNILLQNGLFSIDLGMKGSRLAYGEETAVIEELKMNENVTLGFNPNLIINHLVSEEKLKISWHLSKVRAVHRDRSLIDKMNIIQVIAHNFTDLLVGFPVSLFKGLIKWLIRPEFYWQNFLLQASSPWMKIFGRMEYLVKM